MNLLLIRGSASHLPLADESVQTCVTSPPYWGLRQYAGEQREVWGGDPAHAHEWTADPTAEGYTGAARWQHSSNGRGEEQPTEKRLRDPITRSTRPEAWAQIERGGWCACGAWYGALGLEPTPELYVEHMVAIFREVRRVLRRDGTLWLNLGDSYAASGRGGNPPDSTHQKQRTNRGSVLPAGLHESQRQAGVIGRAWSGAPPGYKPKDLVGIPWRVAFALQADGWYLRSDIIWHKPNPMPESVTDRPTKSHEYLFLLTKSERYFYDADAIREDAIHAGRIVKASDPETAKNGQKGQYGQTAAGFTQHDTEVAAGRNKRTVWTIATRPYPGAHFATYPEQLVEPCILAGSRRGDVVLDPFNGSGTTGRVAIRHGRSYVGVDISNEYLREQASRRIDNIQHTLGLEAAL